MTKTLILTLLLIPILLLASWFSHPHSAGVNTDNQAAKETAMLVGLRDGQFPVRWVNTPLFEFTGPLPYFVGAGLLWLGVPVNKSLTFLIGVPIILGLLGGYSLGEKLFGKWGGLSGAIVMCFLPFHNVSEAWVIMCLPWILFGSMIIIRQEGKNQLSWQILLTAMVTLFLSQTQTLWWWLVVTVLFTGFTLVTWFLSERKFRPLLTLKLTTLLALGLSAFYLLPLYGEKKFATDSVQNLTETLTAEHTTQDTTLILRSQEQLYSVKAVEPIQLNHEPTDFPGWQFEVDGKTAVQVPPGNHTVGVLLTDTPLRLASDLISLLSFVILLSFFVCLDA